MHENNLLQLGKIETLRARSIEWVRDPGGKPHCRRRQTFCLFLESVSFGHTNVKETLVKVSGAQLIAQLDTPDGRSKRTLTEVVMIAILLVVLLLVFCFGGYRMGPGIGYYGGGGLSLIVLIVLVLLLLHVI